VTLSAGTRNIRDADTPTDGPSTRTAVDESISLPPAADNNKAVLSQGDRAMPQ